MTIPMALGWTGAVVQICAYALFISGRLAGRETVLHLLNVVGGSAIVAMAVGLSVWPSVVLNVAWVGIAIVGVARATKPSTTGVRRDRPHLERHRDPGGDARVPGRTSAMTSRPGYGRSTGPSAHTC